MNPLNYLYEILAFINWATHKSIPATAQALWFWLMFYNNDAAFNQDGVWYWPVEFKAPRKTLVSVLDISPTQLNKMRNCLIQAERIVYKKRGGSGDGTYRMIPFATNYFTQTITQTFTQVSTQVWSQTGRNEGDIRYINIKYQDINCKRDIGVDDLNDSELARARGGSVESCGNGGKPDETRKEAAQIADRLFSHYFGRAATEHDVDLLFEAVRRGERQPDGSFIQRIDTDKAGVLEYAFRVASEDGMPSWKYLRGVLSTLARRKLTTLDACEDYDAQREFDKDNRR